jgi:hypothetical protein
MFMRLFNFFITVSNSEKRTENIYSCTRQILICDKVQHFLVREVIKVEVYDTSTMKVRDLIVALTTTNNMTLIQ